MRSAILAITLSLLLVTGSHAQAPIHGHVAANAYVNTDLKFSYAWPAILRPYDTKLLNLPKSAFNSHEFFLFSARQGKEPYGVIVLAEKLNVVFPHARGFRDGTEFVDWVVRGFQPAQHAVVLTKKHFTTGDGVTFDQLVYTENGVASSATATQMGKYLVVFKCNAKSAADLAAMNRSVVELKRGK
jgi:hypothetical protein